MAVTLPARPQSTRVLRVPRVVRIGAPGLAATFLLAACTAAHGASTVTATAAAHRIVSRVWS